MHTLVHVAAPLVGADGVGRVNSVRRRIRAANALPIGRPQGIATTRHPPKRSAETTVWCRLPLLAIDGGGILPPAFPVPAGA